MEFAEFDAKAGARVAADVVYGHAPLHGYEVALRASLYLPREQAGPVPVLVWWHGGGFETGHYGELQIRRLARQLTNAGFALAAPEYRLGADEADLSQQVRGRLDALDRLAMTGRAGGLAGARAIAACEDAAQFLAWLEGQAGALSLSPRPVLGGSGAGAVTAFNAGFLAPWLGLTCPEPAGIISISGGFAWPGLYEAGRCPVFALHNPTDARIGIASVRALSQKDAGLELIEAFAQEHGVLKTHRDEPKAVTFGRIRTLLARWSDEQAAGQALRA